MLVVLVLPMMRALPAFAFSARPSLMPMRLLLSTTAISRTTSTLARKLAPHFVYAPVYSSDVLACRWGPPDDGRSCEAPSRLISKAMLNGIQKGRGGKGSVFVFASGNGGAMDDQCNFDGYTNSIYSVTVGAIDREGLHPYYSEACSAVMVITYSSGSGDNIHTTDVGKQTCTSKHGGTSAAAPIAAGILALVLEVRPDLTWRDVQHLCVNSAVVVNPKDPDWDTTWAGRPYNHKYGYGNLDTWSIIEAAKTWELVRPQAWLETDVHWVPNDQQTMTADGVVGQIEITAEDLEHNNFERLEHITVRVDVEHQRRGNIEVQLISPNGIISSLARPRRFDSANSGLPGWTFMTVKHWCASSTNTCPENALANDCVRVFSLQGREPIGYLERQGYGPPKQRQNWQFQGLEHDAVG